MKKIAKRQSKDNQKWLLFHSLHCLIRSDSEMFSWPNNPLLVMLQFVDPDVLSGDEHEPLQQGEVRLTPLHDLADLAAPSDVTTHENQLTLAKHLIERGANVNAVSSPEGITPLHTACSWYNVTNLHFVKLLLKKGADPNAQDHLGQTPLMWTVKVDPGAAKFLLNWPATDANITSRSGASFLALVRLAVKHFFRQSCTP
jgi:ankyrin repeat protein